MKISRWLGQVYFFGMQPKCQVEVAETLRMTKGAEHTGEWRVYSRLSRPGLVAIRKVTRSTGLDIFLLEDPRLRGVEDVAEMMFYSVEEPGAPEFPDSLDPEATLFITFVRLNWDVLNQAALWEGYGLPAPSRSQIFGGFSAALRQAREKGMLGREPVTYHLGGGVGDCDALIIGTTRSRSGLNSFLSTLGQLGTDNLALQLGVAPAKLIGAYPIIAESVTELGVSWDIFQDSLGAAEVAVQAKSGRAFHADEERLRARVNGSLEGDLRTAVFLRRTHGTLSRVSNELKAMLPQKWVLQEVLGEADILLRFSDLPEEERMPAGEAPGESEAPSKKGNGQELADLLCLTARLDVSARHEPGFPRRHSVVLSFDRSDPQSGDDPKPGRAMALGQAGLLPKLQVPMAPPLNAEAETHLRRCAKHLQSIRQRRLREELRIIERMVERCAVLQRQTDLPWETRRICQLGLQRIARTLEQLDSAAQGDERLLALRHSLVNSGAQLERTIAHLSRGNVPMLLATPTQARATDHFSSETTLARALAAPASSVAQRLTRALEQSKPSGNAPAQWANLMETLGDMAEPIIYISHGLDFSLTRPLGILHVPRWIIWYPTACSMILHEVGHAVFTESRLDDLLLACATKIRRQYPALLEWCEGISQATLAPGRQTASGEPAQEERVGISRQWQSDQHEVAAELFHRLFSYPAEADQEYLCDQLEYLHAIINRSEEVERVSFITRVLTVHVAHALLMRENARNVMWDLPQAQFREWVWTAVDDFRRCLRKWLQKIPAPLAGLEQWETEELIREVKVLAETLAVQREKFVTPDEAVTVLRDFETSVGRSVQRAIFMALAACAGTEIAAENNHAALSVLVWDAIFESCSEPERREEECKKQFDNTVEALKHGAVVATLCPWPERLPRELQRVIRRSSIPGVQIHQRIALTLYLADWMGLQGCQGKR